MLDDNDKVYELKNFKEHKPLKVDISEYTTLEYSPNLPYKLVKEVEPALTEGELYDHMSDTWDFSKGNNPNYYKNDCINFLVDTDFQAFLIYGKLNDRKYIEAKEAYLFDSFLRNFLQEILERIEIYIKKMTSDALLIGYTGKQYIFDNDDLYFENIPEAIELDKLSKNQKKYTKANESRVDAVLKTQFHIYKLIDSKRENPEISQQIEEYGIALPWSVFRMMTFGNIANFLVALKPSNRNKVAYRISAQNHQSEEITSKILLSWVNALRYLRNLCSHGDRLYKRLHNTVPKIHRDDRATIDKINLELNFDATDSANFVLFVYFLAMKRIVEHMSQETKLFWNNKIEVLDLKFKESKSVLPLDYGFPIEWKEILLLNKDKFNM